MAMKITDECSSCGACEAECAQSAISQAGDKYVIDPAKCNECAGKPSKACADACSMDAIVKA